MVHALSSQWLTPEDGPSTRVIVYNQWTLDNGWTEPIDILLSPVKEARITDAYLDETGILHVVFWGGDGTAADIYYSNALAVDAGKASAWSPPLEIAQNAGDPESALLVEDARGTLHVVYSGREQGKGVYEVQSEDGGRTWSTSNVLFLTVATEPNIVLFRLISKESGSLHIVWNVYSEEGQGRGIYYARSENGSDWSDPVALAIAKEGLGTQTPTLIVFDDELFMVFNMTPKIMMRRSTDDGNTWSDPALMFPRHVGVNGRVALVIDASDQLHLFFGQRITASPDVHGMWHSMWSNNRWTEPESLARGPRVEDPQGRDSFDPFEARAAISRGNVILVVWRTDPGLTPNGVWFSYKMLDISESPLQILPTPQVQEVAATPTGASATVADLTPIATEGRLLPPDQLRRGSILNPGFFVAVGMVPVALLIVWMIIKRASDNRP